MCKLWGGISTKSKLSTQLFFNVTFSLDFDPRKSVQTKESLPLKYELDTDLGGIRAMDKSTWSVLTLKGEVKPMIMGICYSSPPGSPGHLLSTPYHIPWKEKKYECIQGFNSTYTHKGSLSYGADFGMTTGTAIIAAREGTVVDFQDGNKGSKIFAGFKRKYDGKGVMGNYVIIRHESNIYSSYQHLKDGSISVKVRDHIQEGQKIAESGNSGQSNEPHLHFDIRSLVKCKFETIEFSFSGPEGKTLSIKEGERY